MSKHETQSTRRRFLGDSGRILAAGITWPILDRIKLPAVAREGMPAASENARTLVVIYLRGGADALNVVIPWSNNRYYGIRPTIAIPRESKDGGPAVIKLTDDHGIHPAMAPLKQLFEEKRFTAVLGVGSPHPTRSHFDAQDFMEYAAPGDRTVKDGWLNRYLRATRKESGEQPMRALAMQGLLPRSLRGREPVLAVPRLSRNKSEGLLDLFDDVYRGEAEMAAGMGGTRREEDAKEAVIEVGRSTIEVLRRFWDITEKTEGPGQGVTYPNHRFGRRMALLARVIKSRCGLEVAALDLPSWDHHQGEGATDGLINRQLRALSGSLDAFFKDLGPLSQAVTVLVMTEFGRTVAENGNRGTDHGRGGCMLALGAGLSPRRRIIGDYGSLKPKDLYDGRDLNVDIDFRQVFAETLEGVFGFKPGKGFFPRWSPGRKIGLMRRA